MKGLLIASGIVLGLGAAAAQAGPAADLVQGTAVFAGSGYRFVELHRGADTLVCAKLDVPAAAAIETGRQVQFSGKFAELRRPLRAGDDAREMRYPAAAAILSPAARLREPRRRSRRHQFDSAHHPPMAMATSSAMASTIASRRPFIAAPPRRAGIEPERLTRAIGTLEVLPKGQTQLTRIQDDRQN